MINPIREKYQCAKALNAWAGRITVAASFSELVAFVLSKVNHTASSCVIPVLYYFSGGAIILVSLFSVICAIVHLESESERRKMAIDNAYEKFFACDKSAEYYNNDDAKKGLQRLANNTFESCFFTNAIVNKMLKGARFKAALLLLPFLAAIFSRELKLFVLICNLGIATMILSEWLRLEVLRRRTQNILQNFRTHYSASGKGDKNSTDSVLLMLILDYEAAVSWSHILLSEKVYERENATLSKKWEEMKAMYGK